MKRQSIRENTTSATGAISESASYSPAPTVTTSERRLLDLTIVRFVVIGVMRTRRALGQNRSLVRRSLTASLVVGTVLVMINQGPALLHGDLHHALSWRVPLNYLVPFLVATWGALTNRRR